MSLEIIERAKELKKQVMGEMKIIEAAGLSEDGKALKIYVKPITNEELQRLFRSDDLIERAAMTLVIRARDKDGNRIFANEKNEIIRSFPPDLLLQTSREINNDLNDTFGAGGLAITVDEVEAAKK